MGSDIKDFGLASVGALVERLEETGHWWMVGKGKTRPSEPLYGCLIQEAKIDGTTIASGEGPSMPSAIERALAGIKTEADRG